MLLQFGVAALRAGNTAARTREHTGVMAQKLGLEGISASFTLDSVTVSVKEPEGWLTAAREIGPPGINVWRIGELERLADGAGATPEPRDIAAKLAAIQSTPPQYSRALLALAIAAASAGFAFLNGAAVPEMLAAAVGGGIGQTLRSVLVHRSYNQYGVAALAAVAASGAYVLAAALASRAGLPFAHYPAGFIASVLFLVPGFPLIAALFDMLQNQTTAAVGRLAQGMMLLACVALGLSIVIAAGGVDIARQPPPELVYPLKIALRAVASFIAACAFAMLFNSPPRAVLAVGLVALVANPLRLILIDVGLMPAPAAFVAALLIAAAAVLLEHRFKLPRPAMVVPAIVIMVPGIYAFETIVLFNRGQVLEALQAAALCGFVIGALAMGLAAARFFQPK